MCGQKAVAIPNRERLRIIIERSRCRGKVSGR